MKNSIDKDLFKYLSLARPYAKAIVRGSGEGIVEFYPLDKGVIVVADIEDLPETKTNIFAFHIHEGDSCDDNFEKTGGHYNPSNFPHPRHAGDMPPLFANDGDAFMAFYTDRFSAKEIVGKTVIIHDGVDDFTSQPAGNSGNKIACGVIERSK